MPYLRTGSGFNLLEVIIAVLIFNVAVVSGVSIWVVHSKAVGKARSRLVASLLAEQQMELALAAGYYSLSDASGIISVRTVSKGQSRKINYHWIQDVSLYPGTSDLKILKVTVRWSGNEGKKSEVHYETLVSASGG